MHGTSGGAPVPLSGYGGLVTLADPSSVPEGASPRTYDTDFLVGEVHGRPGLTSIYAFEGVTSPVKGPGVAVGSGVTWSTPNNILANDGQFTSTMAGSTTGTLNLTEFAFDEPSTVSITGVEVTLYGYTNSAANISVQLILAGVPFGNVITVPVPTTSGPIVLGSFTELWGNHLIFSDVNRTDFGISISASSTFPLATVYLDWASIQLGLTTANANFNFVTTFTAQNGDVRNLALDANGNLWVENLTQNPGFLNLAVENIAPGSYAVGVNGPDVEYLAFTDGTTGSDLPLQYTPRWIDRITQVGPGAAPTFSPGQASTNNYPILTITQFPPNSDITDPGNLSCLLQSAGPGSTAPGNVITVYYSPGFFGGAPHPEAQDQNLVNQFNAGVPVYVYLSGTPFGAGTYLVTSIGNALPPGLDHFRYYFTVQANNTSFENIVEAAGQYQLSVATVTTSKPVPGLAVGNKVTISGASIAGYDSTWTVTRALNSASMVITQTAVTGSVATYNYSISSGSPPATGQLVTVTGTTNANGALNVNSATITSSTGGASGTFTVAVAVTSAASVPEDGLATTAGTQFEFDPGITTLGTGASPIFGNSTGGVLTFIPDTAQLIGPGTRQGTVFFITRNGYFTAPAPPVTFTCPENTTSINVSNIPVGPPNVIARGISITDAGQNGTPGGNFFTLPTPVDYVVNNQTFTSTSFYINDNTSTTATLSFTDNILLNGLAIDTYGYNLFNQIEIGDPGWIASYDFRNFYGLCRNKVQNFLNLSFDGGYLPTSGQLFPLGWTTPDSYGQVIVSPRFGDAYYIKNTTASTLPVAGLISQSAFEDWEKQPILNANTQYSVRIAARIPSGNSAGNLVITLTSGGSALGTYTLPFSSLTSNYQILTGTLLTSVFTTVPSDLMLNVSATSLGTEADMEIDRVEIYPTNIPVLGTTVFGSYAGLPEQVDDVTGVVKFESENIQPVNAAHVMYDTLYAMKAWQGHTPGASMYSLQSTANLEPADWAEPEVAQKCGAIGVLAYDFGEQWLVMANRAGLYLFEGGQPGKISQEIFQVWESINWNAGDKIWVLNDVDQRRLFVGVPMPTPNFWLPNAPINNNPTSPNVILMCNYQGLDSGGMLKTEPQMHTTMFGTLNAIDMRRKWSIWQIPSPYAAICINSGVRTSNIGPPPPPPLIPQTAPAMPPPVTVPPGTGVAWAYPTVASPGAPVVFGPPNPLINTSAGAYNNFPVSNGVLAGGTMSVFQSGGGFGHSLMTWSGFSLAPGSLPADAVITAIIPTITANYTNGGGVFGPPPSFHWQRTGALEFFSTPSSNYPPTQFSTASAGSDLSDLATMVVTMEMFFSLSSFAAFDNTASMDGVGMAIYYTSATPTVETVVPLPLPPIPGPPVPQPVFTATNLDQEIYICNGRANSKIYALDDTVETDDGILIDNLYTTAGLMEMTKRQQAPVVGWGRMRWSYMVAALESLGLINCTLYPNQLIQLLYTTAFGIIHPVPVPGYNFWQVPGGFTPGNPALNDAECSLNFVATRTYIEFRENDGHRMSLSNLMLFAKKDSWNAVRGAK